MRYRLPGQPKAIVPDEFEIASAARMSMSIPYFFEPVLLVRDRVLVQDLGDTAGLVNGAPNDRLDVEAANKALGANGKAASFRELDNAELKQQVSVIIDGGTLSNFPVWLFDVDTPNQPLRRPTFGFTLTGGKGVGAGLNNAVARMPWAVRFGFDIFHTSQEAWDKRFVSHSTRVRTIAVDAGNVGTTQFNLTQADQNMLINNGKAATAAFLADVHAGGVREHVRPEVRRRARDRRCRGEGACGDEELDQRARVHELDEPAEHVGVGRRQHAVAEVEDVPGPAAGSGEHVERARLDALPRAEQQRRVEVALDAALLAGDLPAGVERHAPVEPDHVAAGRRHAREQRRRRSGAEVDRRHVDRRRGCVRSTARRTRRSPQARARRPTSRRAGSRRRRRATFAAT